MDHNLEDSLNLEGDIVGMDFGNADVVVSQDDITLDAGPHDGGIDMEFENIEEQPMLMDTGNEEIIVSDFMGDQFNLQEYSVQDDQTSGVTTTEESNQQVVLASQADTMIDLHFEPQTVAPLRQEVKEKPKYIAVKAAPSVRPIAAKKNETTVVSSAPRQIAIAPKPPKLVPSSNKHDFPNKQFTLAPKPVALVTNRSTLKKVPLSSIQGASKGSVLAQIGKQIVMMPSGSGQKIKLVTTSNTGMPKIQYIKAGTDKAQLLSAKNVSGLQTGKPVMAKVIMQGQSNADISNQPAVITKILPTTSVAQPQARYIMQQKTVPISTGHKVLLSSPTGMVYTKRQQIVAIKPPPPKLMPAPAQGPTTKKVVITANPSQNVILKTTAPPKTAQVTKDGKVVLQGQRSELHQINVPGKGIQYIRLITNQTPSSKAATKTQASVSSSKTYVVTDSKGVKTMAKSFAVQPPPLIYPGNVEKLLFPKKLVRIASAPGPAKSTPVSQVSLRSAQSLLAPLSPMESSSKMEEYEEVPILENTDAFDASPFEAEVEETELTETVESKQDFDLDEDTQTGGEVDSKAALHALIADAVAEGRPDLRQSPVEEEDEDGEDSNSMKHLVPSGRQEEHPLIVISNYVPPEARDEQDDSQRSNVDDSYQSPNTPPDVPPGDLAFKPRRACNCTKSQCLKLYCDCFANGEFCNRCNCNNCHNNLENEELRQKAIRACLERNPNAFRPKIGKTKAGGPEIIRRHNKGCNCKRSGCLKNYCECYEAKIACTAMCKCVGCRNVEETLHRGRRREPPHALYRPPALADPATLTKQPCSFMTTEVIEAVCQCLLAASVDNGEKQAVATERDPARDVIEEFSRCLQDIISAAHHHPQGHA